MNKSQKQIVGWGIALFLGMALFPPWTQDVHRVEYSWFASGPDSGGWSVSPVRLLTQWFVLAVVFTGLYFLNAGPAKPDERSVEAAQSALPKPMTGKQWALFGGVLFLIIFLPILIALAAK